MTVAYVRAVSPLLEACALTHLGRVPIDVARAVAQHAAYVQALRNAGLAVDWLPPLPQAPDGVFVEDTALLLNGHAVMTRPGDMRRAGETASVAAHLADRFSVQFLAAGRLDGGDVLRIGRKLFVGRSSRTDAAGIEALRAAVAPMGFAVEPVRVSGCLHLKTAATWLAHAVGDCDGNGTLLVNPAWVDPAGFHDLPAMMVQSHEPWAANVLQIGGQMLVATGAPHAAAALAARGYCVTALDISELQKAEAGLTCMSLIG